MKPIDPPIVSVIIPVYNVAACLPSCLESLRRQSLSNIEILCIDDASTDNSAEIINDMRQHDSRIHLLQQKHAGVSAARNNGIDHAHGQYVIFVDGDDWIDADMLRRMVEKANETACDIVVCSAQVHFEQQGIHGWRRRKSLQAALIAKDRFWVADGSANKVWDALTSSGSWPFVWNKLIRRDLIISNSIRFSHELALGEDGAFLQILFQYANKICYMCDPFYHYRYQRKASATVRLFQNESARMEQHIQVSKVLLQEFAQRNLLKNNGTYLLRWILQFLYPDFVLVPASKRKEIAARIRHTFASYPIEEYSSALTALERKRLSNMLADRECTQIKRFLDLICMKIQNKITAFFH